MKSYLFLTFKDQSLHKEFLLKKNKEITILSAILLFERFIFGCLALNAHIKGFTSQKRVLLHFGGQLWHLCAMLIAWRFPVKM